MRRKTSSLTLILFILAGFVLTTCNVASGPTIKIEEAWGRPGPMDASLGVLYMKIHNTGDQSDRLLSASSPACGVIEIHETILEGDVMSMHPEADGYISIPAGETVEFKSGGLHLMCIDKQQDFAVGAVISLALQFESAGELELQVEVKNP